MNSRSTASALLTILFLVCFSALAQPKSGLRLPEQADPAEAARSGKALVKSLLSQVPEGESRSAGIIKTRRQNQTREVGFEFLVMPTVSNVISSYLAKDNSGKVLTLLKIEQTHGSTNRYFLSIGENAEPKEIVGSELNTPFAGTEFSAGDLGLEFLHWPVQAVTGKGMKRGQSCEILESRSSNFTRAGYSKVVSWIASQKPGIVIVHADAYDEKGKLLKQFDPKNLERVQGQWQLQRMEMFNRQTNTRSTIEFEFATPAKQDTSDNGKAS